MLVKTRKRGNQIEPCQNVFCFKKLSDLQKVQNCVKREKKTVACICETLNGKVKKSFEVKINLEK